MRKTRRMKLSYAARRKVFWQICIPVRTGLAYWAVTRRNTQPLRALAALIGYRWLSGAEMAVEGFFGGPAWWASSRPLHGALWMSYAVTSNPTFLVADTAMGAANWLSQNPNHSVKDGFHSSAGGDGETEEAFQGLEGDLCEEQTERAGPGHGT